MEYVKSTPANVQLTFSLLFNILDQGPSYYSQAVLQMIQALIGPFAGTTTGDLDPVRVRLSHWLSVVSRFVNGPLWKEAQQLLGTTLRLYPTPTQIDDAALKRQSLPYSPSSKEFLSRPGSGLNQTAAALNKVLETYKSAKVKKSPSSMYNIFEKVSVGFVGLLPCSLCIEYIDGLFCGLL